MEISKKIIKDAFTIVRSTAPNAELVAILTALNAFSFEMLLVERQDNSELHKKHYQLHAICGKAFGDSIALAATLAAAIPYLESFLSGREQKELVIFWYVNCYLKIDISFFKRHLDILRFDKDSINSVVSLIKSISLNINIPANAPYHEVELMERYLKGIQENNLKNVYDFTLAVERGGRGFHFNFLAENLIEFLYDLSSSQFYIRLNSLSTPTDVIFYLQSFSKEKLTKIMNSGKITSHWAIFECMRLLADKIPSGTPLMESEINAMTKCLSTLYEKNKDIYQQTLEFFHNIELFNLALGRQVKELVSEDVVLLFAEWLPFKENGLALAARDKLHTELNMHVDDATYQLILSITFDRWRNAFDTALGKDELVANRLYQTDYANFVVCYYSEGNPSVIIALMIELLDKLIWIDSEWFPNESRQKNTFNMLFSYLYLLSYVYKNKGIDDTQIRNKLEVLRNNNGFNKRFTSDNFIEHLAKVFENIVTDKMLNIINN